MFFNCSVTVIINNKAVQTVAAVSAQNDSSQIGGQCDIIVPLNCRIQYLDGTHDYLTAPPQSLFAVGDPVTVTARYIDENGTTMPDVNVFTGFVADFVEGSPMKIKCSDYIYLLNQSTVNLAYPSVTLKQLISDVLKGTGISLLLPTLDLQLVNITFRLMSPAAILQWLKTELGINISLSGTSLYVNVASNTLNVVKYDSSINVIKCDLQTPEAVFLKYKVKAWFIRQNGTKDSIEVGDSDGHLHEVFYYKVTPATVANYTSLANEALLKVKQHVYSGEVETLLYPDVQLFDKATYNDVRYPARSGNYVVTAIHFDLGHSGFHRKLKFSYLSTLNTTS